METSLLLPSVHEKGLFGKLVGVESTCEGNRLDPFSEMVGRHFYFKVTLKFYLKTLILLLKDKIIKRHILRCCRVTKNKINIQIKSHKRYYSRVIYSKKECLPTKTKSWRQFQFPVYLHLIESSNFVLILKRCWSTFKIKPLWRLQVILLLPIHLIPCQCTTLRCQVM